jgi:hypothetical protein
MVDNILCPVSEYDPDVLEPLIGLAVIAAVNMSAVTKAVGAVVSESSGCDCPVMDNWSPKHSRALDDGSCPSPSWRREEGASGRVDGADAKSATRG